MINLILGSAVDQEVDVIVNAANKNLMPLAGICGEIYKRAGLNELDNYCKRFDTPLNDGDAVISPSFNIKNCDYVIHAVGPDFSITPNAIDNLYKAYYNSLNLVKDNNLHSIAFPLISAGIFGGNLENPVKTSTECCIKAYNDFINENRNIEIDVFLCAFTNHEYEEAKKLFS